MRTRALGRHVIGNRRWVLTEGFLSGALWMASLVAIPPIVGWIIDISLAGENLVFPLCVLLGMALAQAAATGYRHWVASRIFFGVRRVLQQHLVDVFDHTTGRARERLGANLVSLSVNDSTRVAIAFDNWCRGSASVLGIGACLVLGFLLAPAFGWLVLGCCTVLAVVNVVAIRLGRMIMLDEQRHSEMALSTTVDIVNRYTREYQPGWHHQPDEYRLLLDNAVRAVRRSNLLAHTTRAVIVVTIALMVVLTVEILSGAVSVGALSSAIGYVMFLQIPVAAVCEFAFSTARARITLERMKDAMAERKEEVKA